jgi:hypothetical protein
MFVPVAKTDTGLVAATLAIAGTTVLVAITAAWSALLSARQMKRNLLPIVVPAKPDGGTRVARFSPAKHEVLENADSFSESADGVVYLAFCVRNIGSGVAVIKGIAARLSSEVLDIAPEEMPSPMGLMRVLRAYYIGPGETTYLPIQIHESNPMAWQAMVEAITAKHNLLLDLVYSDHAGRQLTVSRVELRWATDVDRFVARMVKYWRPYIDTRLKLRRQLKSAPVVT